MVQSINGKITFGDDPNIYKWTSKEDQDFFFSLLKKHRLIIMGSKTYLAAKERIKPTLDRRRIILTSRPEAYTSEQVAGQIEFSSESPKELITRLSKEGFETVLLVGGGEINRAFLEENLVDELYLTLEPRIFGRGNSVFAEGDFEHVLQLLASTKLNDKGTLLLHYLVMKNGK